MTLLTGRGSLPTPIAAPIAVVPLKAIEMPTFGRIPQSEPITRFIAPTCDAPSTSRSRFSPADLGWPRRVAQ